jgi:3-oxoacyl-[acyl-carrier protein] reductase
MIDRALYVGKIFVITGSRRGVGKLLTEHVLENQGFVIGFARGKSSIDHERYAHMSLDITDSVAVLRAFSQIAKTYRKIDVVINNAAVLTSQYAMIMSPQLAQAMINTNLFAGFLVAREGSKLMRKSKWGRIINISSMAVPLEPIGDSIYAACKVGLEKFSNILAKEIAPFNITCNTLGITAIKTDMLDQLPQDKIAKVISDLIVPRFATSDDIFNVFDFLISDRSSYITAQTIYLGGVHKN